MDESRCIIFAQFDRLIELMVKALLECDVRAEVISSRDKKTHYDQTIADFREPNSDLQVLVVNDHYLETNLAGCAQHIIFAHPILCPEGRFWYNDTCAVLEKNIARLLRPGKTTDSAITVHHVLDTDSKELDLHSAYMRDLLHTI